MKFSAVGILLIALFALVGRVEAQHAPQGWIFALGYTPEYCKLHPGSNEPQCTEINYWALNGLQRDFGGGETQRCDKGEGVTDEALNQLLHVVPNRTSLRLMWRKHGACSGLEFDEYFVQLDRAGRRVTVPETYREVLSSTRLQRSDLKQAFVQANLGLSEDAFKLVCNRGALEEFFFA